MRRTTRTEGASFFKSQFTHKYTTTGRTDDRAGTCICPGLWLLGCTFNPYATRRFATATNLSLALQSTANLSLALQILHVENCQSWRFRLRVVDGTATPLCFFSGAQTTRNVFSREHKIGSGFGSGIEESRTEPSAHVNFFWWCWW